QKIYLQMPRVKKQSLVKRLTRPSIQIHRLEENYRDKWWLGLQKKLPTRRRWQSIGVSGYTKLCALQRSHHIAQISSKQGLICWERFDFPYDCFLRVVIVLQTMQRCSLHL